ncbi:MAG TPA: DUF5518 domain-containing protein [Pyrinomonadaceae bacterium]|nr:DUF5518 domain-containing protein [Pyrinomonadaceae bacterium]
MDNKWRSAIIGGVVIGLLSGIPYVRLGNVACCMWVVLGGALASYLYIKRSPTPVNVGEGALIGAIAGAIGMIVEIVVGLPMTILTGYPELKLIAGLLERMDPQRAEEYRHQIEELATVPFTEQFFHAVFSWGTLLSLLITVIFALIGGLIAVPIFEKRKTDAGPPPPPPYFGNTPGGAYAPPPPPAGYGPES